MRTVSFVVIMVCAFFGSSEAGMTKRELAEAIRGASADIVAGRHQQALKQLMNVVDETNSRTDLPPLCNIEVLALIADCHSAAGVHGEAAAWYRKALAGLAKLRPADDPAFATANFKLGRALTLAGDYDAAVEAFERALKVAESSTGSKGIRLGPVLREYGLTLHRVGRSDDGEKVLRRAVAHAAAGSDAAERVRSLTCLGQLLHLKGSSKEATAVLEQAREGLAACGAIEAETEFRVFSYLGQANESLQRTDAALNDLRRALAIAEAKMGPACEKAVLACVIYANALRRHDRVEEALDVARRVRKSCEVEKAKPSSTPANLARIDATIGALLLERDDRVGARRSLEAALTGFEAMGLRDSLEGLEVRWNLGRIRCEQEGVETAIEELVRVTEATERLERAELATKTIRCMHTAKMLSKCGRHREALTWLRRVARTANQAFGPVRGTMANDAMAIILTRPGVCDLAEARRLVDESAAALTKGFGAEDGWRRAYNQGARAVVVAAAGDASGACDLFEQALATYDRIDEQPHREVLEEYATLLRSMGKTAEAERVQARMGLDRNGTEIH